MPTNSSHENSEKIKRTHSDVDELQEIRTKTIAREIVDEKVNKFLGSVKWVVGTVSIVLAFFGWTTFSGMRDKISAEIKVSVYEQIRKEISNQSILEGLERDFEELQNNLVLENLKLRVNLYNDGKQWLLGGLDKNIISKRYETVLKNMIYRYGNKANEVINILNNISLERSNVESDFFGGGFDMVKKYVDTTVRNTKDAKLKLACTRFLINFCIDESEKFSLVMDYLQNAKDNDETTHLLPRIAFHMRSGDQSTDRDIHSAFLTYCKDKIQKADDPFLLMSSYLSLLCALSEDDNDFKSLEKNFEKKYNNGKLKMPDFIEIIDFLMEFDFVFLSKENRKEYTSSVAKFLSGIYSVNNGLNSSFLKTRLFAMSNINKDLYLEVFRNLLNDKNLSDENRLRLLHQFSVQSDQDTLKDYRNTRCRPGYFKNVIFSKIKVRVD